MSGDSRQFAAKISAKIFLQKFFLQKFFDGRLEEPSPVRRKPHPDFGFGFAVKRGTLLALSPAYCVRRAYPWVPLAPLAGLVRCCEQLARTTWSFDMNTSDSMGKGAAIGTAVRKAAVSAADTAVAGTSHGTAFLKGFWRGITGAPTPQPTPAVTMSAAPEIKPRRRKADVAPAK